MKIQVINGYGEKEPFKPRKIKQQIIEETKCDEDLAQRIQDRVSSKIYKLGVEEISTRQIRAEVSYHLLKEGMADDAENILKMGMSIAQIEALLENHSTENANNNDNSESFYKRIAEGTLEEYTLAKLPKEISQAHTNCYIHIHDRNDFFIKPNCFSYSIPWLLQNGFSPDGDRQLGATSSPPKHFDTLMNLMHELLGCGKIDLSGGQNFPHANVYLAPCSVNLSYDELKQNLQSLLFNLNQAIMSKGEVVFSSMGWDLEIPSYMKEEDAIGLGGVVVGKYKDYEDEAKRILKIWCELLQEGDSRGVPFRFPNNIFTLRDDYENSIDEQLYWICEYLCKFPTGYFSNDDLPNTGGISTIMGCFTGDTKLHFHYDGESYYESFNFIDDLISAEYGANDVKGFKLLGIIDYEDEYGNNKVVDYVEPTRFIKNQNRRIYHVVLEDGNEFDCDDTHTVLLGESDKDNAYEKVSIFEAYEKHLKIANVFKKKIEEKDGWWLTLDETYIKNIIAQDGCEDTYCFEANGSIIVDEFILTGNCRTRNTNADPRWSWQDNTLNNGNLAFHSLNLPLFALESENIDEFYELLTKYCNIALDGLCLRRRVIEDRLANDKLPFLMWHDKKTGRTLYEVERTTLSVGYVGLDETVKELTNGEDDITTDTGVKLGIDIINHIQKLCNARKQETGYKVGVFSTPAESTAHRFAKHNKKKYPKAYINGKGNDIFYTNSHHIQVAKDVLLTDHLRNAETFHKLTPFGAICHVFLGTKPTVESLVKLTKLIKKHDIGFWSYTLDFTICNNCQQTFLQALDECPNCGSTTNLTVYSKITGYYVPVYKIDENGVKQRQWNDGKVGEFQERKRYSL